MTGEADRGTPGLADRSLTTCAAALAGLAMLFLTRRNWGLDHDATLYFGQALALRSPAAFARDLFFLHGSQASYTVFPWVLARLMDWFDPLRLFYWGGFAGLLFFAVCSWSALHGLLPPARRYWAWLGVLLLPSIYGRSIIFSYAEPFLTPRPWSEGLCLLGIGLLARGQLWTALVCVGIATLLHPLPAIAAMLVVWPWLITQDGRWWHALWFGVPLLIAAIVGIAPFSGLLIPIDAEWLEQLRAINGQLFVTGWARVDYYLLAFDAFLLFTGWRLMAGRAGAWCLAGLVGLALGIGGSLLLVDVLHLALPAALQLWRVHWLGHWLAMMVLASVFSGCVQAGQRARAAALGTAAVLVWFGPEATWIPFAMLFAGWPAIERHLNRRVRFLLVLASLVATALLTIQFVTNEWLTFVASGSQLAIYALDRRLLAFPVIALGLAMAGALLWRRATPRVRAALVTLLLLPAFGIAISRWDMRSAKRQILDAHADSPELFGVSIPTGATVFWADMSLQGTWSVLGRADYFDPQQLSGLAFHRATLVTALGRIARLEPLLGEIAACRSQSGEVRADTHCEITGDGFRQACTPGSPAPPDYLVLPTKLPQPSLGRWLVQAAPEAPVLADFRLYRCGGARRPL